MTINEHIMYLLVEKLGGREEAHLWLTIPNKKLSNRVPMELIEQGRNKQVLEVLI